MRTATSEWARAWMALVEGSDPRVARRLHLGRTYHRAGRVTGLRLGAGGASVRVQGERSTPTSVALSVPELDDEAWGVVLAALGGQVRHTARLLAGHEPESLDTELQAKGIRLVPARGEVATSCDCDDDAWPCAHVAALWELLAERIAADPFTLLKMRGRGRERLLAELAATRRRRTRGDDQVGMPVERLRADRWSTARAGLDGLAVPEPAAPRSPAGTLRLLGDPPGWAGGVGAWDLFGPLVAAASDWVRDVADD